MFRYNKERAQKAYDNKPSGNINKLMSSFEITDHGEVKVHDHRVSFELRRIADSLNELVNIEKNR